MLEELVRNTTGGRSWDDEAEVSVRLNNGLLFVRQTPEVHADIRRLLGLLGRSS